MGWKKRDCPAKQAIACKAVHYREAKVWRTDRIMVDAYEFLEKLVVYVSVDLAHDDGKDFARGICPSSRYVAAPRLWRSDR